MSVDYEKEYDNRSRVPEHPEIFARWEREGKDYRAARPDAKLGIKYGPTPRQIIDFFPAQSGSADTPLALLIHGGWWRSLDPKLFSQLAAGPNSNGVDVAVVGYELCPNVSIATIIEQMRAAVLHLWRDQKKRVFVYGHSAGGHLAACLTATDWKTLDPTAPADLVPAAYAISGVFELSPLTQVSQNADVRLTEETAHAASPVYGRVPAGRVFDAVVGALKSSEFLRQSRTIADAWRQGMALTRYEEIAKANHFTVVDPLIDPNSAMTERVVRLAERVNAMALGG
jgi:arylformamidase